MQKNATPHAASLVMINASTEKLILCKEGIESWRFTVFGQHALADAASAWFYEFFGIHSETDVRRKGGIVELVTQTDNVAAKLTITGGIKADFTLSAESGGDEEIKGFTVFPAADRELRTSFIARAAQFVAAHPDLIRIAAGEEFAWHAEDRQAGYAKISQLLRSIDLSSEGCSDFRLQINRPRVVQIEGVEVPINRLMVWCCKSLRIAILNMGNFEQGPAPVVANAASVQTDVNTKPECLFHQLNPDLQKQVVFRLFDQSLQISEDGDRP